MLQLSPPILRHVRTLDIFVPAGPHNSHLWTLIGDAILKYRAAGRVDGRGPHFRNNLFPTTRRYVYKHAAAYAGHFVDRSKSSIAMLESLRILLVLCCCVFLGTEACSTNTSNSCDVFLGTEACSTNTSNSCDVFLGTEACSTNTSNSCDVFLGTEACSTNTSNSCDSGFYLALDGASCVGEFDACCACVTLVNVYT